MVLLELGATVALLQDPLGIPTLHKGPTLSSPRSLSDPSLQLSGTHSSFQALLWTLGLHSSAAEGTQLRFG